MSNPDNLGYGGNQKIGYYYAIKNQYDFVALVHGDGQYAPELLDDLIEDMSQKKADAVFGSRMLIKGGALKGGMPLYKFIGNKILTFFQNKILSSNLSEFHSGYRIYSTDVLKKIPFYLNSNNYSFVDLTYSKAYLRHLFSTKEALGRQIATIHNLAFYIWLVKEARQKIIDGTFFVWKTMMVKKMNNRL